MLFVITRWFQCILTDVFVVVGAILFTRLDETYLNKVKTTLIFSASTKSLLLCYLPVVLHWSSAYLTATINYVSYVSSCLLLFPVELIWRTDWEQFRFPLGSCLSQFWLCKVFFLFCFFNLIKSSTQPLRLTTQCHESEPLRPIKWCEVKTYIFL